MPKMSKETLVYQRFLKENKVVMASDQFVYDIHSPSGCKVVPLAKERGGMWRAGDDGCACHTKRAAAYWHIKNNKE